MYIFTYTYIHRRQQIVLEKVPMALRRRFIVTDHFFGFFLRCMYKYMCMCIYMYIYLYVYICR